MTSTSKSKTVERLLDVALELVLRDGFRAVSVERIIEAAGVSKGTFFYHFASKDVLAIKMLERFRQLRHDEMIEIVDELDASEPDPLLRIKKIVTRISDGLCDEGLEGCLVGSFSYQLLEENPELKLRVADIFQEWIAFFADRFRAVEEVYPSKRSDPEALAIMLFSMYQGWMVASRICVDKTIFKKQVELFTDYLDSIYGTKQEIHE